MSTDVLCDTGPLVALLDADDPHHGRCVTAARSLPARPLVTTWPCFTEAMHLAYRIGKAPMQDRLWDLRDAGKIVLHVASEQEADRMRALMRQYRDTPMDLADASLVAAAEALGVNRIFTIDGHFHAYRMQDGRPFLVIP